jgi:hypothetical protein
LLSVDWHAESSFPAITSAWAALAVKPAPRKADGKTDASQYPVAIDPRSQSLDCAAIDLLPMIASRLATGKFHLLNLKDEPVLQAKRRAYQ